MGKAMPVLDAEFALLEAEANGAVVKTRGGAYSKEKCPKCSAVGVLGTDYETESLRLSIRFCAACRHEWRGAILKR